MAGVEAAAEARPSRQLRRRHRKAGDAQRREIAAVVGHEQHHAIDEQRLHDARDEPLGQPVEIEVGVEVAREPDERPAVVVAIAVERAVEPGLNGVLHRAGEQHHHRRGQQRDHPVRIAAAAAEAFGRDVQQHRVDAEDRRNGDRPHEHALEDHLDVHQAVADDGRREGQRHEAERDRRQLHRQRRLDAEGVRHRVAQRERQRAERRAPDDPAQLPPRRHRTHVAERLESG